MTHLQEQLDELDLLESVFSAPGEFDIEDRASKEKAETFLKQLAPDPSRHVSCKLCIPVNAHHASGDESSDDEDCSAATEHALSVSISVRLDNSYPDTPPEVYVSAGKLKRYSQDELNSNLQAFIKTLPPGEACLLTIVEWIRDNSAAYFPVPCKSQLDPEPDTDAGSDSHFCRLWLYMHHIYSKTKRRNILSLSGELELTGFCLPGKPGVVCVEGTVRATREFYSVLRRWNWKSIGCRHREVEPCTDIGKLRKIDGFAEVSFDMHGHRQNHMDMGQFLAYLRTHNLEYMFKELFGMEGH